MKRGSKSKVASLDRLSNPKFQGIPQFNNGYNLHVSGGTRCSDPSSSVPGLPDQPGGWPATGAEEERAAVGGLQVEHGSLEHDGPTCPMHA